MVTSILIVQIELSEWEIVLGNVVKASPKTKAKNQLLTLSKSKFNYLNLPVLDLEDFQFERDLLILLSPIETIRLLLDKQIQLDQLKLIYTDTKYHGEI